MYIIPIMHAVFVVHCWVSMRPLNHVQPTNLQLYSNQSTNHCPRFEERGPSKVLLLWVSISVDRSLGAPALLIAFYPISRRVARFIFLLFHARTTRSISCRTTAVRFLISPRFFSIQIPWSFVFSQCFNNNAN